jgi:hypothetical protein
MVSTTGTGTGTSTGTSTSASTGTGMMPGTGSKVDLVLMVDNSRNMGDKQQILADSISTLVGGLVNPPCIDGNGVASPTQPATSLEACPNGFMRAFAPVLDIHIGVVSSSLGGHGADVCTPTDIASCNGTPNVSNDDAGHLLARKDVCAGGVVPTYQSKSFLAWDPAQKLVPPGEATLGQAFGMTGLVPALADLVHGAGQVGCGFESQLESWYRFLVDPDPYQSIQVTNGSAALVGTDAVLLKQRADFLRPSSILAVVMLTDENDCSTKEGGQFYFANQVTTPGNPGKAFRLPRARAECAIHPNDPCCKSCGQAAPNCPADPTCAQSPTLTAAEDSLNLRCENQKQRFGIDFLYPLDRYTSGLTSPMVPDRQGNMVSNPVFSDLDPTDMDSTIRTPSMVVLAGIVGVPWQAVARDSADLTKGFKTSAELAQLDAMGHSTWDRVLGDPAAYVAPLDAHMIESTTPRAGLPAPGSAPNADPSNGHEYTIAAVDDLEYACVFTLPTPRDCTTFLGAPCECVDPANDNPVCSPNPGKGNTLQTRAKAYPGLRELAVLKGLGAQGVVGSVCPAQLADAAKGDYGYRPAMVSISAAIQAQLK